MDGNWKLGVLMVCLFLWFLNLGSVWCINEGGVGLLELRERVVSDPFGGLRNWNDDDDDDDDDELGPCSWSGDECSDGKVVILKTKVSIHRRLLIEVRDPVSASSETGIANPLAHSPDLAPSPSPSIAKVTPTEQSTDNPSRSPGSGRSKALTLAAIVGGCLIVVVLFIGIFVYRTSKVAAVRPWATGLSGQLQKAFVTGVPKLKRSELETACEDFSNVIGSSSIGTVYKGTLSSGVEIAVTSIQVKSANNWSKALEAQFRKKIDKLSVLNHKNFVNLLGHCEEEEPFTRMMVFEYAPNGTLFEHLHIKESEHLNWEMRMRIAMGLAYCLNHMHQRKPPVFHKNLDSSAINITEDYAAKISEFNFWNQIADPETDYACTDLLSIKSADRESNVYSFGVLLYEMITGRLPYSIVRSEASDWASEYLRAERPIGEKVDPTLTSFGVAQVDEIGELVKCCVQPDSRKRPNMGEVAARLRGITGISPEEASPRLSPLWWAELEIASVDAD